MKRQAATGPEIVRVVAPNLKKITLEIQGTAPLVMHKFSQKAKQAMLDTMSTPKAEKKSRRERPPRDYDAELIEAQHISTEGWVGMPCPAFRAACIAACRLCGLVMTQAKLSLFVLPDGFDSDDGTPLVKLVVGAPEKHEIAVRLETGVFDIRVRPMWREWGAGVTIEYDADLITADSIANLLDRAGRQVGIGEGRPFSKLSVGMGWGTFRVVFNDKEK